MKIFSASQIREIDAYTIKNEPIESIDLMERAANALFNEIIYIVDKNKAIKIFAGPGNNGGDGLALARMLANDRYKVEVYILKIKEFSDDFSVNLKRLENQQKVKIKYIVNSDAFPVIKDEEIIIDALFGSGLNRPLDGLALLLVKYINSFSANVISIDIPSGLFCDDNTDNNYEGVIRAKYTFSFQFPKLSFLFSENEDYVGKWKVLPIGLHPEIIEKTCTNYYFIKDEDIRKIIKIRKKFSHKGTYGHALLISGGYGKMGAAVLASGACLRSGSGLVTIHIPKHGINILQTSVPEVMISIDKNEKYFSVLPDLSVFNAYGVGPGIGTNLNTQKTLKKLLLAVNKPLVIDADALNILSIHKEWLNNIPAFSILTPHPKEFERLVGKAKNSFHRISMQIAFASKYNVCVILKGAYTSVAFPDGNCYFNSTGNPGMATGGSGDVLTGIITGLLAQGYNSYEASILGVYMHGLAGDIAAAELSEESMTAGDIINFLSEAFRRIKLK
jgi:NAD(P)H-hydrate epimerase